MKKRYIRHASELVTCRGTAPKHGKEMSDIGLIHDGAVIISDGRIVAARCTLPITDRQDLPARYGMRHKAAIGVTEDTDADVIVVSEETGGVSFVHGGIISPIHNINELKLLLSKSLDEKDEAGEQAE